MPDASGQAGAAPTLALLRILTASFCVALVLIGVVAVVLHASSDATAPLAVAPAAAVAVALALTGVAVSGRIQPTLGCASPDALAATYRTRLLLRYAICEGPALVGFALGFLAASPVPYLVAMPISIVGILRSAPRTASLAAEDERMAMSGCGTSLQAALAGGPASPIS